MGFAILIIIIVIIFVLCTVDFEAIYGMFQKIYFSFQKFRQILIHFIVKKVR
ncbi:hypothetical protein [Bacillus cereus]|uniref:hypothetical protein n=1 Tax=Bacillus cereus TaxID=1396 RepID=UPI001F60D8A7|nr:hypothetical protein [Bacillus cereus]